LYGKPVAIWLQSKIGSALAAAIILICFALTPDTGFIVGLCTAPLLLALIGDNTVSQLLSLQPIYFLGEISFSIYLGHFLFTTTSYRLISPAWMATGTLHLVIGLFAIATFVITLSTLTYYFIERPARGILRNQPIK
jgi:peptidoglycan/LPS O-acetylase OafA/YrhL